MEHKHLLWRDKRIKVLQIIVKYLGNSIHDSREACCPLIKRNGIKSKSSSRLAIHVGNLCKRILTGVHQNNGIFASPSQNTTAIQDKQLRKTAKDYWYQVAKLDEKVSNSALKIWKQARVDDISSSA
jgi:hypothetical protein